MNCVKNKEINNENDKKGNKFTFRLRRACDVLNFKSTQNEDSGRSYVNCFKNFIHGFKSQKKIAEPIPKKSNCNRERRRNEIRLNWWSPSVKRNKSVTQRKTEETRRFQETSKNIFECATRNNGGIEICKSKRISDIFNSDNKDYVVIADTKQIVKFENIIDFDRFYQNPERGTERYMTVDKRSGSFRKNKLYFIDENGDNMRKSDLSVNNIDHYSDVEGYDSELAQYFTSQSDILTAIDNHYNNFNKTHKL